jgi:hypothetical protein
MENDALYRSIIGKILPYEEETAIIKSKKYPEDLSKRKIMAAHIGENGIISLLFPNWYKQHASD